MDPRSVLLRPFQRAPTPLASVVTALGVGLVAARIGLAASGVGLGEPRVLLLLLAFALAAAGVVLAGSAIRWGTGRSALAHARVGLTAALVLGWVSVDALHYRLFQRHVDQQAVALAWEALGSRSVRLSPSDLVVLAAAIPMTSLLVALAHAGLSRLACREQLARRLNIAAAVIVLVGLSGALLKDRLWDERHDAAARLASALPWASNPGRPLDSTERGFGADQDTRTWSELRAARPSIEHATFEASVRPDLLIVHVESLRSDVFTPELMPKLTQLGTECFRAPRHYSTGNNTGSSVFGLVTGLGAYFYPGARAVRAPALPLVVLHGLGYRIATHLANNLQHYDNVFDVVFGSAVDDAYTAPDAASNEMDTSVVDHYLSSLDRGSRPRFDYLVLDSTHYDYAYPPEYEKHTPSGTLELGARDTGIFEPGINERMKPKAPLVKNRYLNAVSWVDDVISRLVVGLRSKGRWDSTWVAIVGDHGEAFFEHGQFGHGNGLENEQVQVPFVLCGPRKPSAHNRYSSHADLMPTWFDLMQVRGVPSPFMSGRSLLHYSPQTDVAVVGMGISGGFTSRRFVAIGHGLKVMFVNEPSWPIQSVADEEDRPLATVPELAFTVLFQALTTKTLRSPASE